MAINDLRLSALPLLLLFLGEDEAVLPLSGSAGGHDVEEVLTSPAIDYGIQEALQWDKEGLSVWVYGCMNAWVYVCVSVWV